MEKVLSVVDSIVVVCPLFSVCDLEAIQTNARFGKLYFASSNRAKITSLNHPKAFVVREVKVQLITVTRRLKKFRSGSKNL